MSLPDGAAGLDLGSTRIKAGFVDGGGNLGPLVACDAPPVTRTDSTCEVDAEQYLAAADRLLKRLGRRVRESIPAGLSTQRSTFLLQDERGRAVTPLISWQDTRAADWCRRHHSFEPEFHALTGLMLSAHYVGPKLAVLAEQDAKIGAGLRAGRLQLRTLDTLFTARHGGPIATDPTMAARTGLFDLARQEWSEPLCRKFGVDPRCLPAVGPTNRPGACVTGGLEFRAGLADQSAGLVALTGARRDSLLINLGTGTFVLRAIDDQSMRRNGYLTGMLRADANQPPLFALEGAIGGSGPAIDRFRCGNPALGDVDPAPELFAIPDGAGLGSPYWRPEIGVTFSQPERALERETAHRLLLEGLLFRVRELCEGLCDGWSPARIVISGGLSREPFVAQGLATVLDRTIERIDAAEAAVYGAALVAAPEIGTIQLSATRFDPGTGGYLRAKFDRWREWLHGQLT